MAFTLIVGPMKSGKSLELIARVAPYEFAKQKVVLVQPTKHVRDKGIRSRAGIKAEALAADSLSEVSEQFDVIGIDEIHMFPDEDVEYIEQWLRDGKQIIVSGLDVDYRGSMPPIVKALFEQKPDEVITKKAVCDVCRDYTAQFSQILHKGKPVLEGLPYIVPEDGTYEYQARCRVCFTRK